MIFAFVAEALHGIHDELDGSIIRTLWRDTEEEEVKFGRCSKLRWRE